MKTMSNLMGHFAQTEVRTMGAYRANIVADVGPVKVTIAAKRKDSFCAWELDHVSGVSLNGGSGSVIGSYNQAMQSLHAMGLYTPVSVHSVQLLKVLMEHYAKVDKETTQAQYVADNTNWDEPSWNDAAYSSARVMGSGLAL